MILGRVVDDDIFNHIFYKIDIMYNYDNYIHKDLRTIVDNLIFDIVNLNTNFEYDSW